MAWSCQSFDELELVDTFGLVADASAAVGVPHGLQECEKWSRSPGIPPAAPVPDQQQRMTPQIAGALHVSSADGPGSISNSRPLRHVFQQRARRAE